MAALARLWPRQFAQKPNTLALKAIVIEQYLEKLRVEKDPARREHLVKRLEVLLTGSKRDPSIGTA